MASTSVPSSTATERAASLAGVRFTYPGGRRALEDVTLTLRQGATALLGPNGSGKSTMISLLAGRLTPTAGRMAREGSIGFAAQSTELDPEMTGREHLCLFAALTRASRAVVDAAIERFGLAPFADVTVARLSGGMRRRVHLATSWLGPPALWLLDEPTGGLDPEGRAALEGTMREVARQGAVVFATHDLALAERVADRIVLLLDGCVVEDASVELLVRSHGSLGAAYDARVAGGRDA